MSHAQASPARASRERSPSRSRAKADPGGPRCAIYLRVSTDRQHTDNQRPEVEQLARARGFETLDVFEEKVSATAKNRQEWQRLRAAAHAGKLDVVVVFAIDRIGRTMVGNIQEILELDRIGVRVISVTEPWMDTSGPVRTLLIAIFSWVAEQEHLRIRERVKAGLERARREGKRIGRPRAFVPVARAVRLRRQGLSYREIARRLRVGYGTLHRALQAADGSDEITSSTASRAEAGAQRN
jgi:putative DNA-invertase from lambdoid prophage Rac